MVRIGAFALMLKGRKAAFTERGATAPAGLERSEPPGARR